HYARIYQVPQPENKVHHSLQAAGLFQHRSKPVRTFSHGMQQRLSLVRALIHEPNILLLDEPFTGLDQEAIQFLNEQITQLKKQGATVLLVMHQPHPMLGVATHIAWLKDGKISHHIPLTRLNDAPDLQAYLQEPR
ncbi:MAG: ATP-binding cassette domain-containing protein, partial [Anaerolineales bacterium]